MKGLAARWLLPLSLLGVSALAHAQAGSTAPESANQPQSRPPAPAPSPGPGGPAPGGAGTRPQQPSSPPLNFPPGAPETPGLRAGRPGAGAGPGAQPNAQALAEQSETVIKSELEPKPGGLTADEVVRRALEHSPALKKSTLEADKAAANRARARIAFAPRIDLQGKFTHLSKINLPGFNFGGTFIDNPFRPVLDQWYTQAGAVLPVTELFLTILPTYRAANLMADVSEQQRKAQELQVSYDARVAFYDYAHARAAVVVAQHAVHVAEASMRDIEALVRAGSATQTELARSQSAHANTQSLLTQLEGLSEVALERLQQATGDRIDPARGIGEPLVDLEFGDSPSVPQLIAEAKDSRPELHALRTLAHARTHLIRARRGAEFPQVSAFANGYYANPNSRYTPPLKEWKATWDVGVAVTWSPNDFALAYTQTTDAETDLALAHEDLRATEQGIAVEAATAVTAHRTAIGNIAARRSALEAARRFHADQRSLLLAGAATPNDVLLAERDLTQASLDWVDSFIQGRVAEAGMLKAQGKTGLTSD